MDYKQLYEQLQIEVKELKLYKEEYDKLSVIYEEEIADYAEMLGDEQDKNQKLRKENEKARELLKKTATSAENYINELKEENLMMNACSAITDAGFEDYEKQVKDLRKENNKKENERVEALNKCLIYLDRIDELNFENEQLKKDLKEKTEMNAEWMFDWEGQMKHACDMEFKNKKLKIENRRLRGIIDKSGVYALPKDTDDEESEVNYDEMFDSSSDEESEEWMEDCLKDTAVVLPPPKKMSKMAILKKLNKI